MLRALRRWLTVADPPAPADLIFSLAGGPGRKEYALHWFHEGYAPAVLLSTARFEIRRFVTLGLPVDSDLVATARSRPPEDRYFLAFYDGDVAKPFWFRRRLGGTLSEIVVLRDWLRERPQIKSVLVISSGFHLRRVRLCCRALLPPEISVRLIALPEAQDIWCRPGFWPYIVLLLELVKLPAYAALLTLNRR